MLNKNKLYLNSFILKERLSGNQVFFHKFSGFLTNNNKIGSLMYIIHAIFTAIIILIFVYSLLVVLTILNIVDKKMVLVNINNLYNSTSKIEKQYNQKILIIDNKKIEELGFIPAENNIFIERKDKVALSFLLKSHK